MHAVFAKRLKELSQLLKTHKVKRAYAFGSVVSEKFTDESDIDILVRFEDGMTPEDYSDNYFNLLFALQKLFNRDVDLVSEAGLRNPYFISAVNRTKQPIYE